MLQSILASRRALNVAFGLTCFALVAYAVFAQQGLGFEPCPLCIFQRVAVAGLGVAFLLAALPGDQPLALRRSAGVLVLLVAAVGAAISARHVWIQSQPPGTVAACGATLDFMLEVSPVSDVVRKVLTGSGECGKIDWTFLGLSMPGWVFLWTAGLGLGGLFVNWRRGSAAAR